MVSKIRSGILSCIGLIFMNLLRGIVMIPGLELNKFIVYSLIIQVGLLWFSISLWIVLRYDLVKLNNLNNLKNPINWLIRNIAAISGLGIIYTFLPNKEIYLLILFLGIILIINYIIVFIKIYKLDKNDLEFIGDLHNYLISIIIMFISYFILSFLNEFIWHIEIDFALYFLSAIPILFILKYLQREKKDIENKLNANLIDKRI